MKKVLIIAALVQKNQYPQVSPDVYVYAPRGNDLDEHLKKVEAFNTRKENPTAWNEIVYTGPDFFENMTSEKKGNVMVTAGNNRQKTEYILNTLKAGINVLADKPMGINSEKFGMLEECFRTAEENGLLLYDIMTERFEISTILQKEEFPEFLLPEVKDDMLDIIANGEILYNMKGLNARLTALWAFEPPAGGGDTLYSTMRGTKANLLIKQGPEQGYIPELYIEPHVDIPGLDDYFATVEALYPGISLEPDGTGWHVVIPDSYRTGHEAHFGQVTANFLEHLREGALPEWEVPGMLTKYYTTTTAWKMTQEN